MPHWQVQHDAGHWRELLDWLATRRRAAAPEALGPSVVSMERLGTDAAAPLGESGRVPALVPD
jgi:hypothetical protein